MPQAGKKRFNLLLLLLGISAIFYLLIIPFPPGSQPGIRKIIREKIFQGIAWFKFDTSSSLKEWEEKIFNGRVLYRVKVKNLNGYLNAYSQGAASGMVYNLKFDPREKPMVSWKWRVISFPQGDKEGGSTGSWIEKEDYAARFYIIFPRFPFFRMQCLEYVWAKDKPKGSIITNQGFKNLKIVVVESGHENLGKWVYVERNINEDFKKVFGVAAPKVGAVAIMTDADNTQSTAEAEYDEIKVGYEK